MDTILLKPTEQALSLATKLILEGELVVFPTETVYGLGADAFNAEAVKRIFVAKGRPQDNPLIVHISSIDEVGKIASEIPEAFYRLAEAFMPGPLTVILSKGKNIPYEVTAGGETVGVRMPDNAVARALISGSRPLAAPSANRSKHISPTTAEHVYEDLSGKVPLILDGGSCEVGIESTVLDLTSDIPAILRPGAITAEMLSSVLGEVTLNGQVIRIAKAPGMKYQHYSPVCETVCASSLENAIREYDRVQALGKRPVLVFRNIYDVKGREFLSLGATLDDYAHNVYNALHIAEKNYNYIIIEELNGEGLAASIMNRVIKAAGGKRV